MKIRTMSESVRVNLNLLLLVCTLCVPLSGADYYVSPHGSDAAAGTSEAPFATIQRAADSMRPGDTCIIRGGRYQESVRLGISGTKEKPIRFTAAQGEQVVIDGTERVPGPWELHAGRIWKAPLDRAQVEQLFVNGVMHQEARWPDMPFEERLNPKAWAHVGGASEYGSIEAPGLGASGVDWTGGIAMLNVLHQFFTWTRTIVSHEKGSDFFHYDRDLPGLGLFDPKGPGGGKEELPEWMAEMLRDDRFYLFGKLEALTAPTEWFHDPKEKWLYYIPEGKRAPQDVRIKVRDYGIRAKGIRHIQIDGIQFFGCAFEFENSQEVSLTDCHLMYPNFRRRIVDAEQEQYKALHPVALLDGKNNVVERCSIQYSGGTALKITGTNNRLENSIIRDGCWSGTLHYPLVRVFGENNVIRRNTVSRSGSPLLCHQGPNHIIEFNHFFDGGLLSEDVSGIHTHKPQTRGTVIRYNWIHGIRTGHDLGHGIRGDDITRGLVVHHNVVWDCGEAGITVKGDENRIFNNTSFNVSNGDTQRIKRPWGFPGVGGLLIPMTREPIKPWQAYHGRIIYLETQNANSVIVNNLVDDIFYQTEKTNKRIEAPGIQANLEVQDRIRDYLVDPDNFDFRLKPSAIEKLPKAVKVATKEGESFPGDYIGAYEPGKPAWVPGADWSLPGTGQPAAPPAAVGTRDAKAQQ